MNTHMPELLAPAGGPKEFNAALAAGADAIFCGFGNTFNARRGAESFTSETFAVACRAAHIAGAQVYVTVNVAIRTDEMASVLALVRRAWLLGADAFIIQDWGLLHEVRTRWPEISCHVSTQANIHDTRGVAWCKELGVDRVTLSRELSLEEIACLAGTGVDLESFCHGAICICYSGICHMSSSAGDRSANRGACAQPCRLPYDLVDKDGRVLQAPDRGRPLCPKDFYSFDDLEALVRTGVRSLKVEGRLKGPDYLASVISVYRKQLDDIACGTDVASEELARRRTQLKRVFNRDFTNAYLMGTSGDELMSYERSNNRGELVGSVVDSRSFGSVKVRRGGGGGGRERLRTTRVAEVQIRLDKPVCKGDLLEVRPLVDQSQFLTTNVVADAGAGETITCRTARPMEVGSAVRVIRSQPAMELGARFAGLDLPRKRQVRVHVRARMGQPFAVKLATADGAASAVYEGFEVEPARTRAVTRDDLVQHVGRMGGSCFEPISFDVELDDGCGMSFAAVHEVRACACAALEQAILEPYEARTLSAAPGLEAIGQTLDSLMPSSCNEQFAPEVCAVVRTPQAAQAVRNAGATRVYAAADMLADGDWPTWVIPVLDEVCRESDHVRLDALVRPEQPVAVGNISELALASERGAQAEVRTCIPVHNESCLAALQSKGMRALWVSPELSLEEIEPLARRSSVPLGLVVVGRVRAMTCEHCVLQVADQCIHNCGACALRKRELFLQNGAGDKYPVCTDTHGRSHVYGARPLDLTPYVPELMACGVARFAVDGTLMSDDALVRAVRRVANAIDAGRKGRKPSAQMQGHTTGHLLDPIQ